MSHTTSFKNIPQNEHFLFFLTYFLRIPGCNKQIKKIKKNIYLVKMENAIYVIVYIFICIFIILKMQIHF